MITHRPIDSTSTSLESIDHPNHTHKTVTHCKLTQQATQGMKTHRTVDRPSTDHGSIDHSIDHIKLTLEKLMVDGRWSILTKIAFVQKCRFGEIFQSYRDVVLGDLEVKINSNRWWRKKQYAKEKRDYTFLVVHSLFPKQFPKFANFKIIVSNIKY